MMRFFLIALLVLVSCSGTRDNQFLVGDGTDGDKEIVFNTDAASKPVLRYNSTSNAIESSSDGTNFNPVGGSSSSFPSETDPTETISELNLREAVSSSGAGQNVDSLFSGGAGFNRAHTFVVSSSFALKTFRVFFAFSAATTGTFFCAIRATDGSGDPTGPDLATSNPIAVADVISQPSDSGIDCEFPTAFPVASGTRYAMYFNGGGTDGPIFVSTNGNVSNYPLGRLYLDENNTGDNWSILSNYAAFEIYSEDQIPVDRAITLEASSSGKVFVDVPSTVQQHRLVLPPDNGFGGLQNNGSGTLSWDANLRYQRQNFDPAGSFSGNCVASRIGLTATITCPQLAHGNSSFVVGLNGAVPEFAVPQTLFNNVYLKDSDGTVRMITVTNQGRIQTTYRTASGTAIQKGNTGGGGFSITYDVIVN